jgi:hypothetical protein
MSRYVAIAADDKSGATSRPRVPDVKEASGEKSDGGICEGYWYAMGYCRFPFWLYGYKLASEKGLVLAVYRPFESFGFPL